MKKYLGIFMFILVMICFIPGNIYAGSGEPLKIDLPSDIRITKNDDVSAGMLSKLIGTEWQVIAGGLATDNAGGAGKFSGAFVYCLSVFNAIAMVFVSTAILYIWAVAAVQTAHEGKEIGGTNFNSFWAPLRHITAFTFVVPCTSGGLSFLQMICISIVSFSINMANVVWDGTGKYMIEHSQQGVIDNHPPFIHEESMALIQPMFKASVAQAIAGKKLLQVQEQDFPEIPPIIPYDSFGLGGIQPIEYKKVTNLVDGRYTLVEEPLKGRITLYINPDSRMKFGALGGVVIPYPVAQQGDGKLILPEKPDELAQYQAKVNIAYARSHAIIKMWEQIRGWALWRIKETGIDSNPAIVKPGVSGLGIAASYRESVAQASNKAVNDIVKQSKIRDMLEEAMDSKNGKSELGWASAGLMPFTFARVQSRIDDIVYIDGASYTGANSLSGMRLPDAHTTEQSTFDGADYYVDKNLIQGRIYNPVNDKGDGPSFVNELLTKAFFGSASNNGILASTLGTLKKADPMVVMSNFGSKCTQIAGWSALASFGASSLGWIPFIGDAATAVASNPFLVLGMSLLWTVGITLQYVLPFTVLVMWLWALIKWAATVVYVLVGAPMWAISHIAPQGHGFAGESAREGYYTLIDLALRPALLVIGIIASMGLWSVLTDLYLTLLAKFINSYSAGTGNSLIGEIVLSCIVMIIFAGVYAKVFSVCINAGPALVLKMRGRPGTTLDSSDEDGRMMAGAVGMAAGKAGSLVGGAIGSAQKGAGGLSKYMQGQKAERERLEEENNKRNRPQGGVGSGTINIAPRED